MMHRLLIIPLAAALTAGVPAPDMLDRAIAAYDRGQWADARDLARPFAQRGSAIAETLIGLTYLNGAPRDPAAAAGFFYRAAQRGYAPAQLRLGDMYAEGIGLPQSVGNAYRWYRILAIRADAASAAMGAARAEKVAARLDPETRTRQEQLAQLWHVRAASGR
jgi:TPR repeat protein